MARSVLKVPRRLQPTQFRDETPNLAIYSAECRKSLLERCPGFGTTSRRLRKARQLADSRSRRSNARLAEVRPLRRRLIPASLLLLALTLLESPQGGSSSSVAEGHVVLVEELVRSTAALAGKSEDGRSLRAARCRCAGARPSLGPAGRGA